MKIVVAQYNLKFMTWGPVKLWVFYHVDYVNFNKAVFKLCCFK